MTWKLLQATTAAILAALLLSACAEKSDEQPAPEAAQESAPEVETSVAVAEGAISSGAVVVEQSTDDSAEAFKVTTAVEQLTATVVAIDPETREVVLELQDGSEITLTVSEKAKNLDQVSPGDTVNAQTTQQIAMVLIKEPGQRPFETVQATDLQAKEGQMPARAEITESVAVYTVEAIDQEAGTFKLKDVNGNVEEFVAENPANLAKASVGDALWVKTTDAFAVDVVKAAE